ncbi:MAG: thioredoxin domain-containing protein [Abitibacteriaceae bacterium]|nr:thioredoxin domain-containing protein [Abditibacteriaceae bacterium]
MTYTNQLAGEKSPYLLQHQHNPVDWMPWGEAAFARARAEDKPIFLSVGYSTCHWCHVMERESFENETVATIMNQHFINIKVDREERPDVDRVYMTFVQATTGSGGWPMSVFLTPELNPFYGGTYFPPDDRYGHPGFASLLLHIANAWQKDRAKVESSGTNTVEALQRYTQLEAQQEELPWDAILDNCYTHFQQTFDRRWGGFGEAPKFPRPVQHDFLHRYYALRGDKRALQMSEQTLRAISNGGMNDQLGGGFHRYSVDEQWIVSHFEKMLYDQAQLVVSYLEMYQLTHDELHAQTARVVLDYVLRDMTHPAGGFYSAEDADSLPSPEAPHKEEGAFYVWDIADIKHALTEPDASLFCDYYGIRLQGNAPPQGDPHGEFRGKNILYRAVTLEEVAEKYRMSAAAVESMLSKARQTLFQLRNQRPRPHLDDKIITAWNGLMISAFAQAAQVLSEPRYLEAAQHAADFICRELFDTATGTLRRHYRDGAADVAAFADDYAFLVRGLLDLFEASFDFSYVQWAEQLTETMNREFWDEANGGYFNSAPDPHVLLRMKEDYDGAEPSANSIAALNCVRLAHLLDRDDLRARAEKTLQVFASRLVHTPYAMPELLCARMYAAAPPLHIVIAGKPNAADTRALLRTAYESFLPYKSVLLVDGGAGQQHFDERLPFLAEMKMQNGQATAYVCRNFACQQPVTGVEALKAQLSQAI